MKPLTIEELKALDVGDWVWIKHKDYNDSYLKKVSNNESQFEFSWFAYSNYGTKWLAYKNKEQAELEEYKIDFNEQGDWFGYKYIPAYYQPLCTADTKEAVEVLMKALRGENK